MQEKILFFFQFYSNPFYDTLFEVFTIFGEDLVIISLLAWVYWNLSKNKGFILTYTLITSIVFNNYLKIIFRKPRPYEVLSELKGKRLHSATGYSFPSGHTQASATFYTSLSLLFRRHIIAVISCLIIIAVALSRVYLAVHWPVDVAASVILGVCISFLLVNYLISIEDNSRKRITFILIVNIAALASLFVVLIIKFFMLNGDLKTDDLIKTIALLNGLSLGFFLDIKKETFNVDSNIFLKLIRYILGLAGAFVLINLTKEILPDRGFFNYSRYFATGVWIVYVYPYWGVKLSLFKNAE